MNFVNPALSEIPERRPCPDPPPKERDRTRNGLEISWSSGEEIILSSELLSQIVPMRELRRGSGRGEPFKSAGCAPLWEQH